MISVWSHTMTRDKSRCLECRISLPVNNQDAWVLRIPEFRCESVSPGVHKGTLKRSFFIWTRVLKCQRFITRNNRDAWVLRIPVFHCESISPGAYTRVLGKEVFRLNASFEMPKVQTMEMLGCLEYPYFGVNPFQLVFTRVLWKEVFKLNVSFEKISNTWRDHRLRSWMRKQFDIRGNNITWEIHSN